MGQAMALSPPKKRTSRHFSIDEKERIVNIFKASTEEHPDRAKAQIIEFTAKAAGVCVSSVFNIIREYHETHDLQAPKVYHKFVKM